jgi:VWFA-related protein
MMKISLVGRVCVVALAGLIPVRGVRAQGNQVSGTPTFKVESALVFLDVTVLDKKGHPVVSGLTKDDFTITEDKVPQKIVSFEAPEAHVGRNAEDANPNGQAPTTILVLDMLDSSFEDFAYIRYEVEQFLKAQPSRLASLTELLVVGNKSLEMLQSFTHSRADLLQALKQFPSALPYKLMHGSFGWERYDQSLDALEQIALQNKGVPGRKNIVWVGRGGPNIYLGSIAFSEKFEAELRQAVRSTTNELVDARISLFVIYPGLPIRGTALTKSTWDSGINIGDDPFAGDVNFGLFANETGGKLFYNHNSLDAKMEESEQMGTHYYTLTYKPQNLDRDGKFRRIRVTLRNPNLRAVTKGGYYAPDVNAPIDPRQQQIIELTEAMQATTPFDALDVSLSGVQRRPDNQMVEFTVELKSKNVSFQPSEDGKSVAHLIVAGASLDRDGNILASMNAPVTLLADALHPHLPDVVSEFLVMVRVPRRTRRVRVVVDERGGAMGSAELDRKTINAAPARATQEPAPE